MQTERPTFVGDNSVPFECLNISLFHGSTVVVHTVIYTYLI